MGRPDGPDVWAEGCGRGVAGLPPDVRLLDLDAFGLALAGLELVTTGGELPDERADDRRPGAGRR